MPSRPRYAFREQSLGLGRTFCSSGAEISVWTANEKVTWDTSSLPWTTKGKAPRSPTCNRLGEPLATDQLWLRPLTPAQLAWPPGLCELNYYSMIRTCYFIALYLGLLQLQCRNRRHSTKVTGRGSASAEPLLAAWHLFRTQYACCCCWPSSSSATESGSRGLGRARALLLITARSHCCSALRMSVDSFLESQNVGRLAKGHDQAAQGQCGHFPGLQRADPWARQACMVEGFLFSTIWELRWGIIDKF